jgi:hypothetical protein
MDVEHRAQVPTTLLVQCKHKSLNYGSRSLKLAPEPKTGSLQQFINSSSLFDDYGFGAFSDYEIQKIALFDMRILNCDRHGGNILVARGLSSVLTCKTLATATRANPSASN